MDQTFLPSVIVLFKESSKKKRATGFAGLQVVRENRDGDFAKLVKPM